MSKEWFVHSYKVVKNNKEEYEIEIIRYPQDENISCLVFHRKSLLNPALEHCLLSYIQNYEK